MSASKLADRCWALITTADGRPRGKFFFMSGATRIALFAQRDAPLALDYIYGVRIMIDDAMAPGEIALRPFSDAPR